MLNINLLEVFFMSWFNKIKDTASKATQIAKSKSNEIYEVTKLNLSVNECEAKIEKMFKNAGVLCYRDFENNVEMSEDIKMIMEDIDKKYKEIEELKAKINDIKDVRQCPSCNANNPAEAKFCNSCGKDLSEE